MKKNVLWRVGTGVRPDRQTCVQPVRDTFCDTLFILPYAGTERLYLNLTQKPLLLESAMTLFLTCRDDVQIPRYVVNSDEPHQVVNIIQKIARYIRRDPFATSAI